MITKQQRTPPCMLQAGLQSWVEAARQRVHSGNAMSQSHLQGTPAANRLAGCKPATSTDQLCEQCTPSSCAVYQPQEHAWRQPSQPTPQTSQPQADVSIEIASPHVISILERPCGHAPDQGECLHLVACNACGWRASNMPWVSVC